jgi:hypothetical protein
MRPTQTCLVAVFLGILCAAPVDAATRCVMKTADGTGPTEDVAKFQVYEGLLRSVGQGAWSSWMVTGSTPGMRVGKPVYRCRQGLGLGVSCRGRATICMR